MTEISDQLLAQYLLGSLPPEESERLDELSIADDAVSLQLSEVENDLVDAFARGELSAETARQFKSHYLSTPRRKRKLQFAQALHSLQEASAIGALGVPTKAKEHEGIWQIVSGWRLPQWGFAAAAVALLGVCAYLGFANMRLQQQLQNAAAERAAVDRQVRDLQRHSQEPEWKQATNAKVAPLQIAAFALMPSVRGAGEPPTIRIEPGSELVVLTLFLETDEFAKYQATLEDSASRRDLWHSTALTAQKNGARKTVTFAIRPELLRGQNYVVLLSGVRPNGSTEMITGYPFKAVVQ